MNFRLTYDGPLKAASQSDTRRKEKHEMRTVFSRQLHQLFEARDADFLEREVGNLDGDQFFTMLTKRGQFFCLPLVRERLRLVCDLDVLFLRREAPGHIVSGGGDLDNRIKVLFDALRMPQDDNEVRGFAAESGKRVLLCLTENDTLITGFRVTTDRLLEPATSPAEENNVRLIINVEVKATQLTEENMAYFSHF